jgi:pimeloyl-ACP methyl ester carboxylesterase
VVGHSLGSGVALYLAAVFPARVRRLILVDGGGVTPEDAMQGISASVSRLGMSFPSLDAFLALMRQLPMIPEWTPLWEGYFHYDVETHPDGSVSSRVRKAGIEEEILALSLTRVEAFPDLVHAPTLIIRSTVGLLGPDRGFVLTRAEAERVRDAIAGSQFIEIADTNHYTVITVRTFADAVSAFLGPAA